MIGYCRCGRPATTTGGTCGRWECWQTVIPVRVLAAFAGLALTACATTSEPRVITKEIRIPVPVKCATVAPPDPSYSDSPSALKAAADVFEQAKLLLAGRKQRDARIIELKAAVAGCL